ncbi:MAG: phage portal protein [Clostridia bacterium]
MDGKSVNGQTRPQVKGYSDAGASLTRRALKAFIARSGAPSEDIDLNNYTLRQRGRMLYMASPIATSAINTNRTKVVGTGLTLKSSVDRDVLAISPEAAKSWQRTVEAEFRMWADKKEHCDAIGVNNFFGLQQLALKSWLMSGDCFPLFKRYEPTPTNPYSLRIHLIEADRVSTPIEYAKTFSMNATEGRNTGNGNKIYDGVEINHDGKIVAYHIRNTHPFQITVEKPVWVRVEALGAKTGIPNILHVMDSERPDQYRGVTYLAQVIEPLLQLRRYTESELMAALIQSFFTAWIKTATDPTQLPINETGSGDIDGVSGDNLSKSENDYEMGPGTVLHLQDNEEVVFGNPNIPTTGFESFTKTVCRMIGAALEIPYDVLMKEFNASYSASRAALMEAWDAFKMRRTWFVADFCQPVYETWLAEAVAIGRIKAPGFFVDPRIRAAYCGARWIGPVQGQLDPTKEVKADILAADRAFKTHEQIAREYGGGDWEENVEQLKRENEALRAAGGQSQNNLEAKPETGEMKEGKGSAKE